MSNILLSTFFALMAGLLTAAISFVKLVNDKESRVTDYREEWTNSVRKTLAEVVALVKSLFPLLERQGTIIVSMNDLTKQVGSETNEDKRKLLQQRLDLQITRLETTQKEMNSIRRELNQSHSFARLHFKPNDPTFAIVEHKYDSIFELLKELAGTYEKEKMAELRGQIEVHCAEIISVSRAIIKDEWERIKRGELVYQKTKSVAKWGGVVLFFILFTVGVHAGLSAYSRGNSSSTQQEPCNEYKSNQSSTESQFNCPQRSNERETPNNVTPSVRGTNTKGQSEVGSKN